MRNVTVGYVCNTVRCVAVVRTQLCTKSTLETTVETSKANRLRDAPTV